jgi:hypothetical protein
MWKFTTSSHGLHHGKRLRTTGSYFRVGYPDV